MHFHRFSQDIMIQKFDFRRLENLGEFMPVFHSSEKKYKKILNEESSKNTHQNFQILPKVVETWQKILIDKKLNAIC